MIESRVTRVHVIEQGEPIFKEGTLEVSIEDDASGEYVVVTEVGSMKPGSVAIDPSRWKVLRGEVDKLVKECRS